MAKSLCPNCGTELSRDDIFCGSCGARTNEFDTETNGVPPIKEETTKKSNTEGIPRGITGIIITIVGLFLLFYSFLTAYNLFNWDVIDETFIVSGKGQYIVHHFI